jgi:hypothetical protein
MKTYHCKVNLVENIDFTNNEHILKNVSKYLEDEQSYITNLAKKTMNTEKIEAVHQKLRDILISYGSEEYGDCIVDEISFIFGFPTTTDIETEGEFVNDGSHYQLLDYVFSPINTDDGFTNIEVRDFGDNLIGEIAGVEIPDEEDKEELVKFEEILKTWLRGKDLIY